MTKKIMMKVQEVGLNEDSGKHEVRLNVQAHAGTTGIAGLLVLEVSQDEAKAFARRMFDRVSVEVNFFVEM